MDCTSAASVVDSRESSWRMCCSGGGGQAKRRCKHGHDPKDTTPAGVAAVGSRPVIWR
jgi:hypothetical protein